MKFCEYLQCAQKHLRGCDALLASYQSGKNVDIHVWLELYYLSGYIIEGIAVYSAYKLYEWNPDKDIICMDWNFSQKTHLDFFKRRENKKNGSHPFSHDGKNLIKYNVQSHGFQEIVKNLLRPDPSFNGMPYLGDGEISPEVERLIDNWQPNIRYWYENQMISLPSLNREIIEQLIETCKIIFNDVRYKI